MSDAVDADMEELKKLAGDVKDLLSQIQFINQHIHRDFGIIRDSVCSLLDSARRMYLIQLSEFVQQIEVVLSLEGIKLRANTESRSRIELLVGFFQTCSNHLDMLVNVSHISLPNEEASEFVPNERKKRVLIVDDSKSAQFLLSKVVESDSRLEIAGIASSAEEAIELIPKIAPDIVTLDVHMPGIDGFEFLKLHMARYLIPIVLVSSMGDETGGQIFEALYQGAIDFIPKSLIVEKKMGWTTISQRIWAAANASLVSRMRYYTNVAEEIEILDLDLNKIVGIGVSIGGTRSLLDLFSRLPKQIPPILIVQRIAPLFSKALIRQLHEVCPFIVKEAQDGEVVEPMKVLVAPQEYQMSLIVQNGALTVKLNSGAETDAQKPSIDTLFDSIAMTSGKNAVGVLFGGADADGAYGLLEMRRAGGYTIIQDETECVNSTLTEEAVRIGSAITACWGERVPQVLLNVLAKNQAKDQSHFADDVLYEGGAPRILVVDDSPTIRTIVLHKLRGMGMTDFSEAKNGEEGWNILTKNISSQPYDLVICDQNMPVMTGRELLRKVRTHESMKSLPFIIVTADSDKESVLEAVKFGVSSFVTKPISTPSLMLKVADALYKSGKIHDETYKLIKKNIGA